MEDIENGLSKIRSLGYSEKLKFLKMETNIFGSGMVWLRADFHLHTRADKEFSYTDIESEFIGKYVDRLEDEGIGIGVITNHNKFDRDEYKSLRKAAQKRGVWLLPGVELSVNDGANGIHTLIVFDKDSWIGGNDDYINQFLTSVFEGVANRENENTPCKYGLMEVLKRLNDHRIQGRDSFIILAHVDQGKGFFEELDGGRIINIGKEELFRKSVLGFQKVTKYDTINNCKSWIGGWLPALVQGSDCKSIAGVGKAQVIDGKDAKVYVKIGDFNFDALKYALMDCQHRISNDIPAQNKAFIKSISFSGGKLDGKEICFSPDLNNFIGIRGSGKSAIIEILRNALGIELNDAAADKGYKNDLVNYILGSGGKVTINLRGNDGKNYRLERILGQSASLYDEDDNRLDCSLSAIFNLPVYFGQKDLSNKKEAFETELLQRLVGTRIEGYKAIVNEKEQAVRNCVLELQKIKDIATQKDELEKTIKDTEQKLKIFKDNGVEDKLKVQAEFEKDKKELQTRISSIKLFRDELLSIANSSDECWLPLIGSDENKAHFDKVNKKLKEISSVAGDIKSFVTKLSNAIADLEKIAEELREKENSMAEEFARIKRELNSETINPDTFLTLSKILTDAKQKLTEIGKQEEFKKKLDANLNKALDELNEAWRQEYLALEKEVAKINDANGNLTIDVEFKGRRTTFVNHLKLFLKGTGLRDVTYQTIESKYKDYIEVVRDWKKFKNSISDSAIGEVSRRMKENLADLLTYKVENKVIIKYKGKTLARHSLGQRASALILFLLAQKDTNVLIIDQPEDDLDNQTIYEEVITEIVNLKNQMQFIFATHNANIPVLGESEKVVACDFDDGTNIVLKDGSIDTPEIQKAIVSIMEGGEIAFNKRREIYNIWRLS